MSESKAPGHHSIPEGKAHAFVPGKDKPCTHSPIFPSFIHNPSIKQPSQTHTHSCIHLSLCPSMLSSTHDTQHLSIHAFIHPSMHQPAHAFLYHQLSTYLAILLTPTPLSTPSSFLHNLPSIHAFTHSAISLHTYPSIHPHRLPIQSSSHHPLQCEVLTLTKYTPWPIAVPSDKN